MVACGEQLYEGVVAQRDDIDFRMFVERSQDMFSVATADGYFVWLNAAWTRILGWSAAELQAEPFLSFVHPDDVESTLAEVGHLGEGKDAFEFTNRYRCKNGTYRWIQWNSYQRDDRIYASCRDVTNLKEALRSAEREVQTLHLAERLGEFGHWRVGFGGADPTVEWSPNVYRIHGLEPGAFQPSLEEGVKAYHPEDQAVVSAHIETAIAEKRGWDFRLRLVRPTGEVRHVRAVGDCELSGNGDQVTALFGVFQDLTDVEATARARNQELEQFVYRAAHDLQAPLRTMAGFAGLLREELGEQSSETVIRHLASLERGTQRMQNLIRELFRYAKAAGDDSPPIPIDMSLVARSAVEACRAELDEIGAEVEIGPLPTIPGRSGALESVVLNLVDNAIKYRSDRPLRLEIRCEPGHDFWRFRVTDNGTGIAQKHRERVFQLFERATSCNAEGVGLGLPLCRKVLERLGGQIWAEPNATHGSTFSFTMPRMPIPAATAAPSELAP